VTPEFHERVNRILQDALELEPAARPAFLKEACGADEALLNEVKSLLSEEARMLSEEARIGEEFLKDPPMPREEKVWQANASIGPHQLLQRIGEGGMGEVWLAEQTQPVHRRVALKLIKAGMITGGLVERFMYERQALAQMEHPNIAKFFEAGSTPQGRPYFVMEYIDGVPITQYCDKHGMTVRDRLELFIQVCEGASALGRNVPVALVESEQD
jgi:hypothetical protein